MNEYRKAYYKANKAKILKQQKQYYNSHKEEKKAYNQSDRKKEYDKKYYEDNKDLRQAKRAEWGEANKEILKEKRKAYYQANKERLKTYRETNKDQIREYCRQHELPSQQWRYTYAAKKWKKTVYARDNHTCQDCGKTNCQVHAHHLLEGSEHIDLRYEITNGITLCAKCHRNRHL